MKSVNLIPAPRRIARKRRTHLRRCAVACAAWGVLSALAAAGSHALWRDPVDAQAEDRYVTVNEDIERTERAIAAVRRQLAALQSTLRANESIANQPDWSVLLAVLSAKLGDEVFLKSCHVHPAGATASGRSQPARAATVSAPASGAGGEPVSFVLEVSGVAKTYKAAARFVRGLEESRLFARVTTQDTARESIFGSDGIGFKLECSLDEPAAPADGATATAAAPNPGPTAGGAAGAGAGAGASGAAGAKPGANAGAAQASVDKR